MPVTLPTFAFAESDAEAEACEAAARVAERKAIRAGLDAWRAIGKAESFESWKIIGAALSIGKAHALPSLVPIALGVKIIPAYFVSG